MALLNVSYDELPYIMHPHRAGMRLEPLLMQCFAAKIVVFVIRADLAIAALAPGHPQKGTYPRGVSSRRQVPSGGMSTRQKSDEQKQRSGKIGQVERNDANVDFAVVK